VANVLSQETSGVSVREVTEPCDLNTQIHRFAMIGSALDNRIEKI